MAHYCSKIQNSLTRNFDLCRRRAPSTQEQHNLVPLANTSQVRRFTLLPVATPFLGQPIKETKSARTRPIAHVHLSQLKSSKSPKKSPKLMKLVNAVSEGMNPNKATELISNASSYISGVWSQTLNQ